MVEDRLTVEQDIAPHEGEILSAEVAFDHLDWIDADHGEVVEVELRAVIGLHVDVRRFVGEPSLSEPDIAGSPGDRQGAGSYRPARSDSIRVIYVRCSVRRI
jgi:hypothetical protein